MAIFLITNLIDEGIYPCDFRVVEADSKLDIAAHIISYPHLWETFLSISFPRNWRDRQFSVGSLWDCVQDPSITPERLLELIEMTGVDGDSESQLAINEVNIQKLSDISINDTE